MQAVAVVVLFSFFSPVWQWLEVGAQMNVKVEMRNRTILLVSFTISWSLFFISISFWIYYTDTCAYSFSFDFENEQQLNWISMKTTTKKKQ